MDLIETSQFYDRCQALGIIPGADTDQVLDYVGVWQQTLADVPLDFAIHCAERHQSPYMLRPSQVRGMWDTEKVRRHEQEQAARASDPRACPWGRVCRCRHADGECFKGWVDDRPHPESTEKVYARWCDVCWEAKQRIRQENDKPVRAYGIVGRG